jgi:hypothetical protein
MDADAEMYVADLNKLDKHQYQQQAAFLMDLDLDLD